MARRLPRWQDKWSNGCSVPKFGRPFVLTSPEARRVCVKHDEAYYYGGTYWDRLFADLRALFGWLRTSDRKQALIAFLAVRAGGTPYLRRKDISWAFGDKYFKYGERAQPRE